MYLTDGARPICEVRMIIIMIVIIIIVVIIMIIMPNMDFE